MIGNSGNTSLTFNFWQGYGIIAYDLFVTVPFLLYIYTLIHLGEGKCFVIIN